MATASLLNQIIVNLIRTATLVILLLDVLAIMVFVWGIVKFIFAASNPEQLKKAKGILWWGVIALFVLASVTGIVLLLQDYFGVNNQAIPIPQFGPVQAPGGPTITTTPHSGPTQCVGPTNPCFHDPDPVTCSGGLPLCP